MAASRKESVEIVLCGATLEPQTKKSQLSAQAIDVFVGLCARPTTSQANANIRF